MSVSNLLLRSSAQVLQLAGAGEAMRLARMSGGRIATVCALDPQGQIEGNLVNVTADELCVPDGSIFPDFTRGVAITNSLDAGAGTSDTETPLAALVDADRYDLQYLGFVAAIIHAQSSDGGGSAPAAGSILTLGWYDTAGAAYKGSAQFSLELPAAKAGSWLVFVPTAMKRQAAGAASDLHATVGHCGAFVGHPASAAANAFATDDTVGGDINRFRAAVDGTVRLAIDATVSGLKVVSHSLTEKALSQLVDMATRGIDPDDLAAAASRYYIG